MTRTVRVDPITRIEGHMKINTEVSGGAVADAKVSGEMFRGFENFLSGRHPFDAARIAQRVCGVCHEVHGVASVLALEKLYGIDTPRNGRILRDLILGLHLASDHLLHFYTLSLPDFVDFTKVLEYKGNDPRLLSVVEWVKQDKPLFLLDRSKGDYYTNPPQCIEMVNGYLETIDVRREAGAGMAILGAKVPFAHAILPGGITTEVNVEALARYRSALERTYQFTIDHYIPAAMELASHFSDYFEIGEAHGTFYSNKSFSELGTPLFPSRIKRSPSAVPEPFDFGQVTERLDHTWLQGNAQPAPNKTGAYSWIKAPRYDGLPMEVGPLARMVLAEDKRYYGAMKRFGQNPARASVIARMLARAFETRRLCEHCFDLLDAYDLKEPHFVETDLSAPVSGHSIGFSIAARGALTHEIEAEDGRIKRYNMIVPSTWNFGPSDARYEGVAEKAILGTPVRYPGPDAIEVGRVVRSFDPCTACAVH